MEVEAVNDTVLRGRKRSAYWAYRQDLYFYAVFSKPFTYTLYTDTVQENDKQIPVCKMLLHFETAKDEQVLAKFSISSVDAEGAYKNLQAEMSGWNFDGVRADAKKKWNECLSKIAVKTNDEDQRAIFYTAMYHAFLSPNLFTDVDGRYLGMDLKVHTTDMKHPVYTIFSLWDTFRALHPLLTIVDPQLNTEFIRSLIKKHQEGGIFPKWDCVSNYTGTMVGYHAASLVTDSYVKGYRDFDVQEAYKACLRAAEYDTTGIVAPDWLIPYVMPKHVIIRILLAIFHVTVRMNRWRKHWSMRMMTGVSPCWQTAWEILKPRRSMPVLQMLTNFILILPPVSCVDWIVKVNGVLRSIPVLPITVMMIIARVLHGNGLGLFRMISRDW